MVCAHRAPLPFRGQTARTGVSDGPFTSEEGIRAQLWFSGGPRTTLPPQSGCTLFEGRIPSWLSAQAFDPHSCCLSGGLWAQRLPCK